MNHPTAPVLVTAALLGACAHNSPPGTIAEVPNDDAVMSNELTGHEAMLLVSLDDGTVIMQTIESAASVCFKLNSDSSTTCLTRGAPLVDPATDAVIGYEMIEETIELIARTD